MDDELRALPLIDFLQIHVVASKLAEASLFPQGDHETETNSGGVRRR